MPVRIRLARHGKKGKPFYHIVIADSRAPRDGKFIERVGSYNPNTNPATIVLNFKKALSWLQKGAQPSETCKNILSDEGVLMKNHLINGMKKGALTEEQVETKFLTWKEQKMSKLSSSTDKLSKKTQDELTKKMNAETKAKEAKAEAIRKKKEAAQKANEPVVAEENQTVAEDQTTEA